MVCVVSRTEGGGVGGKPGRLTERTWVTGLGHSGFGPKRLGQGEGLAFELTLHQLPGNVSSGKASSSPEAHSHPPIPAPARGQDGVHTAHTGARGLDDIARGKHFVSPNAPD